MGMAKGSIRAKCGGSIRFNSLWEWQSSLYSISKPLASLRFNSLWEWQNQMSKFTQLVTETFQFPMGMAKD